MKLLIYILIFLILSGIGAEAETEDNDEVYFNIGAKATNYTYLKKNYANYGVFIGSDYYSESWSLGASYCYFFKNRIYTENDHYDISLSSVKIYGDYYSSDILSFQLSSGLSIGEKNYFSRTVSPGITLSPGNNTIKASIYYRDDNLKPTVKDRIFYYGGELSWKYTETEIRPDLKYFFDHKKEISNSYENDARAGLSFNIIKELELSTGFKSGIDSDNYIFLAYDIGLFADIREDLFLYLSYTPSEYMKNITSFSWKNINHEISAQLTFMY